MLENEEMAKAANDGDTDVPTTEDIALKTAESTSPLQEETEIPLPKTTVDYEKIAKQDAEILAAEFPELSELTDITDLDNPLRYAALRDLGLSPVEAYLATAKRRRAQDNRAHLESSVPRRAEIPSGTMSEQELNEYRELFGNISDAEIKKLYKKVTK